ncbi:MAG: class I SAM-dependent methyltransferase [Terricaulis sp.]
MYDRALIPPVDLILDNSIGVRDPSDVERDFDTIGRGIAEGMIERGHITPTSHVLDVGCGLGRVARAFIDYLTSGTYTGVDINRSSISWCKEAYAPYANFKFVHADLFSTHYNPTGPFKAEDYAFPFEEASFDFVYSMSLFTHVLADGVDNYLGQIARVLRPGRRTLNTFFLLDEVSTPLVTSENAVLRLPYEVGGGLVAHKDNPEAHIAFDTALIRSLHAKHGLHVEFVGQGSWSGRTDANAGHQDAMLAQKLA